MHIYICGTEWYISGIYIDMVQRGIGVAVLQRGLVRVAVTHALHGLQVWSLERAGLGGMKGTPSPTSERSSNSRFSCGVRILFAPPAPIVPLK